MLVFRIVTTWLVVLMVSQVAVSAKPNVVFILTDDQAYHTMKCWGGDVYTPHIDSLASEGMRFTNAFTATTVCAPSRYGFLTGTYAGRCAHADVLAVYPRGTINRISNLPMVLEDDKPDIARLLKGAGYVTGMVGKWHLGPTHIEDVNQWAKYGLKRYPPDADPYHPEMAKKLRFNQKQLCKFIKKQAGFDYVASAYIANSKELHCRALDVHNPEWVIKSAVDFIEHNRKKPFFLYVAPTLHHGPHPSRSLDVDPRLTGEGIVDYHLNLMPPRSGIKERVKAVGVDPKMAYCTWLDDSVGAILKKLDRFGIAENTIVIYTTDHGLEFKSSLYDRGGVRIPMMIRWKGTIKAGQNCSIPVQNIDLVPTLLDVCGVEVPARVKFDGRSFKRILLGEGKPIHDSLYFEIGYARAVQVENWKYIAVRIPGKMEARAERRGNKIYYISNNHLGKNAAKHPNYFDTDQLYDLSKDPGELYNLASDHRYADKLKEMKQHLRRYLDTFPDRPFPIK
ncbi:MAG: sulfatase-like hydrolase/transferase [Planctomycetota bacterium]|nr:MAG: sulfatase-like hydrolase/transferase [Planctomycetota bacterium]